MTADIDAFHAAVYADPANPLPRRVYADWLDDRGEAEYAELIRLWFRIDERNDPLGRKELRARRHELIRTLDQRWSRDDGIRYLDLFERGVLPDRLRVTAAQLGHDWPVFLRPRELRIDGYAGAEAAVLQTPQVVRARTLEFGEVGEQQWQPPYPPDSDRLLLELARADHLTELQALLLTGVRPSRTALVRLAHSPLVRRLTAFALRFALTAEMWDDHKIEADQPPAGAVRDAVIDFVGEFADLLPP